MTADSRDEAAPAASTSNPQTYDDRVCEIFKEDPDPLGRVQILCLSFGHWHDRVGSFLANLLSVHFTDSNERVIRRFIVIGEPKSDAAELRKETVAAVEAALIRQGLKPLPPEQRARLDGLVDVVIAEDWTADSVAGHIGRAPERSAVVILEAGGYVDKGAPTVFATNDARIMASDEYWVRNVRGLASAAAADAEERDLFVLLDTGKQGPSPKMMKLLSVIGTDILSARPDGAEAVISDRMDEWRAWLTVGRVGPVLKEIEGLHGLDEDGKRVIRAQVMSAASMGDQALAEIGAIEGVERLSPDVATKLALIAAEAGGAGTAGTLLRAAIDDLNARNDLQTALLTARRLGDDALIAKAEAGLAEAHPDSKVLHQHRFLTALGRCDHRTAAAMLSDDPERTKDARFHTKLADAFEEAVPDYFGLIERAGDDDLAQRTRIECARHALSRGLHPHAIEILLTPEAKASGKETFVLLEAVERALIARGPKGAAAVSEERIEEAVALLAERLGQDTMNRRLRAGLLQLVEPKTAGSLGLPLVASVLLDGARRPVVIVERPDITGSISLKALVTDRAFKKRLETWYEAEAPVRIGRTVFPLADLPADPDQVCEAVISELEAVARHGDANDSNGVLTLLAFGSSVASHARIPNQEMTMVRTVAAGWAVGGNGQAARDMAETLMEIADTPRRRRLAWMGIADVYARCGRNLEASLYMSAGYAADDQVDAEQLWHETLLLNRVLRDQLLIDFALSALAEAAGVLDRLGRLKEYAHRLETIDIQTNMKIVGREGDPEGDLRELLQRAIANSQAVLRENDDPLPAAAVLSQLMRIAREWRITIPARAQEVLDQLTNRLGPEQAERISAFGRDVPTADDLLRLLRQSTHQRYSDDVGTDAQAVTLTARRALDADVVLADAATTCLALEMTFDRAVATPGWDDAKTPPDAPASVSAPADIARQISADGTNVILAGFARDGSLVRVTATDGVLEAPVREDRNLFERDRLREWQNVYPYQYGFEDPSSNAFYTSTANLRFAQLPTGPTVLVADTTLRSFPPNLLYDEGFAGQTRPMAAAPSLSWLAAARKRTQLGDGRRLAWISSATSHGTTLAMIRNRCTDDLAHHGFTLDESEQLPDTFQGASMAIIVAHGGLAPNGDSFQVVSDEGKLFSTADDLARAVHNVGVVILFVCSGGRSDKHPASDATLGLAREILDQGAQAVVASPWPLESIVTPRWLPTFLARWDAGDRLVEAAFQANQAVLAHWPHDLPKGVALTVLGNPDLTRD